MKIDKGIILGNFTNRDHICLIDNTGLTTAATTEMAPSPPEVDLMSTDLASAEEEQLLELLTQYRMCLPPQMDHWARPAW